MPLRVGKLTLEYENFHPDLLMRLNITYVWAMELGNPEFRIYLYSEGERKGWKEPRIQ